MTVCVVVLKQEEAAQDLCVRLRETEVPLRQLQLLPPDDNTMDGIELLNPNLSRQRRQRSMARWLMPFGFLAGATFTQITTLTTFSALGPWGEPLMGGLLGLGSGLMGSFAAAASVNSENEDGVRILRNRHQEGRWLLLVETPGSIELPWTAVQAARPLQVVRLSES